MGKKKSNKGSEKHLDTPSEPVAVLEKPSKQKTKKEKEKPDKLGKKVYEKELRRLQIELVKLQEWVKHESLRVVVIFEGRDAAGKGGVIKRIRLVAHAHRTTPPVKPSKEVTEGGVVEPLDM